MTLSRNGRRKVPSFSLYGELQAADRHDQAMHIEDIASRSRKYLWKIQTHLHVHLCQCVYLLTGAVVTDLEDSRMTLSAPVVICVPVGAVHAFAFESESQGYVLTMDLSRVLSNAGVAGQSPITDLFSTPRIIDLCGDPILAKRAAHLFDSILQEFRQPESFKSPAATWLVCSALWILATHAGAASSALKARRDFGGHDFDRLWQFRQLIEMHYLQHWSVQRYARRLALSPTSLNRVCQSLLSTTALDVIQRRLALEARRRLVSVADSIASVAMGLGFNDPAYFSRFFRKHSGVSPSEFRRRQHVGEKVPGDDRIAPR